MKRATAIILVSLILLSFASCSETPSEETQNAKNNTVDTPSAEEAPAEETEVKYFDLIPAQDYNGWNLQIANNGLNVEYFSAFTTEELTGDAFNDSIYDRNIRVMDKYNVTITENTGGSVQLIKNAVTAGSHDIGFGYSLLEECMGLISQNYVKPISDMPVFDLSKPYWDAGSQKTLTFNGKLYYGHCDISFDHYESMAVLFYNGELLKDNSIETTPYELYTSGKWTIDAMHEMMSKVSRDENGDGLMKEKDDTFGWAGREFEYLPSLYSSNLRLVVYDDTQSTYVTNLVDEGVMAVGDKLNVCINDQNISLIGRNDETRNLFKEGKVLFYSRLMGDFRNLRDKEDDYGIISYPSLEENTDGMVYVQNPFTITIPSDCEDDERLATLIEALAADTYDNVLDVYIEKAVIGKGARDIESADMLRQMMTKRAFDLCYAFGLKGPIDAFGIGLKGGKYASAAQRIDKQFAKGITKALEALGINE